MADVTEQHTMQEAVNNARGKWDDDFSEEELNIPYKREAGDGVHEDAGTAEEEDKSAGDNLDEEVGQEVADYTPPTPVITAQDPGEYQPADYSFEVTLKDGKTQKISTPEEAEALADDPDNFETPKQLMDFINKQNKMNQNLDRDRERYDTQKKTYDDQVKVDQERQQTVQNLTAGFEYLIAKGLMPKINPADAIADWSNAEIAKHEGVKEQIALINYMTKENEQRQKAGIPVLGSALDAFNAWKLETDSKTASQEQRQAGEQRKAAGARVAGVSPAQQGSIAPKGIAVGRVLPSRGAAMWDD